MWWLKISLTLSSYEILWPENGLDFVFLRGQMFFSHPVLVFCLVFVNYNNPHVAVYCSYYRESTYLQILGSILHEVIQTLSASVEPVEQHNGLPNKWSIARCHFKATCREQLENDNLGEKDIWWQEIPQRKSYSPIILSELGHELSES